MTSTELRLKYALEYTANFVAWNICLEAVLDDNRLLDYIKSNGVWDIVTIAECRRLTGRAPISVRWVCTNKGDDEKPSVR